ncbi:MAG: NAD(P)/FAD-dependent oxidoreductase [Syntrophales bacterium]|nr:NAD(P)/FAD-dependent oxidoreductase [Syntrophales bacterium]
MVMRTVIVVGGGASGMMAAGQAASVGAETLLLEKMHSPGRKLGITGKGRCNLTNIAPPADFISHFGPTGLFLRQAFHRFSSDDLVAFFEKLGVPTVVERGGRIFPASEQARDVVHALTRWIRMQGVTVRSGVSVDGLLFEGGRVRGVRDSGGKDHPADAVVIATGGVSYPATGSTGDGYRLAQSVGHSIIPLRPALVPIETKGDLAPRLQGLSLRNVNVVILVNGAKRAKAFGEMIFTHFGLSGPVILSLSGDVADALDAGGVVSVSIDLKPALDEYKLDERILRDLALHGKRKFETLLKGLLPAKMVPLCAEQVGISPEHMGHQITAGERGRLRAWLKDFRLEVTGVRPIAEAIVTAGGVDTKEIDPRTMASRRVDGLYFAGEVINVDADTGGYNLQAAFSTGWLAGRSAAEG